MASVTKFTAGAVYNQLRHNLRQIAHSSNPDIDPVRLRQDYVLSPDRGMSDYDYFQERLSQLYVYGRNDVKVMAGWVVTAPQDLEQEQFDDFFLAVYDFLENRYGEENVIQAVVHDDEGGQPHLHFCFVPVVEDKKHEEGYKAVSYTHLAPGTRVYISWGEREGNGRRALAQYTGKALEVTNLLTARGATVYPYCQLDGRHCEADWRRQLGRCFTFLFGWR